MKNVLNSDDIYKKLKKTNEKINTSKNESKAKPLFTELKEYKYKPEKCKSSISRLFLMQKPPTTK